MPSQATIDRHTAKLRELVKRWDAHIMDLDELNAKLEAELREQRRQAYRLREASKVTKP